MTCEIKSDFNDGGEVKTDVDQGARDSTNIKAHIAAVSLWPQIGTKTRVETCWPGLGDPVVTVKAPGESVAAWMTRHESNCLAAAANDPIDCP